MREGVRTHIFYSRDMSKIKTLKQTKNKMTENCFTQSFFLIL
jgi:hypothetical protein